MSEGPDLQKVLGIMPLEVMLGIVAGAIVFAVFLPPIYALIGGLIGGAGGMYYISKVKKPLEDKKKVQQPINDAINTTINDAKVIRIGSNRR